MDPIILASSSPQRTAVLKELNIPFQVVLPNVDETLGPDIPEATAAEHFATKKVRSVIKQLPQGREIRWILGADTVIALEGRLYGKPKDAEEAAAFLRAFSGKTQAVYSCVALYNGATHALDARTSKSEVTFMALTEEEIEWYVQTTEWHNTAGGYRLQGKGACFISQVSGSPSGVVGLPIHELYDILKSQGYSIIEKPAGFVAG